MAFQVVVVLSGEPQGKGRPRAVSRGKFVRMFTPEKTRTYEGMIRTAAMDEMDGWPPVTGAVEVDLVATFLIPNSWSGKKRRQAFAGEIMPTKKPDTDNILKTWCDAMNGVVFTDDAQIVKATISKRYGDRPGVSMTVRGVQ